MKNKTSIKYKANKEKTNINLITKPAFLPNTCYVRLWVLKQNIMTIKELEKVLEDNDMLVKIQYTKRTTYELRNLKDVKKHIITSKQFENLKEKFNFNYLKSEGLGVRKHYYKR